jgi:hypothetical protein
VIWPALAHEPQKFVQHTAGFEHDFHQPVLNQAKAGDHKAVARRLVRPISHTRVVGRLRPSSLVRLFALQVESLRLRWVVHWKKSPAGWAPPPKWASAFRDPTQLL